MITLVRVSKNAKVSKESVNYRLADGEKRCASCVMWKPGPNAEGNGLGTCTLVMGAIKASDTCDRWEPRINKDAAGEVGTAEDTKGQPIPNFQGIQDTPLITEPDNFPDSAVDPKVYKGLRLTSGIIVVEPDTGGKLWLEIPSDQKQKGKFSIPKGGLSPGYTIQQNAHAELWEETGLQAKIVDWVGDFAGPRAYTRLYLGVRTGGKPEHQETETEGDVLVTPMDASADLVKKKYHRMLEATLQCPTYRKLARGSAPVTKATWEEIRQAGSLSQVFAVLRKNDWENQSRDSHGRFGSGGAEAGSESHVAEVKSSVSSISEHFLLSTKIEANQGNGKNIPAHVMVGQAGGGKLTSAKSAEIVAGLKSQGYNVAEKYGHIKVYNSVAESPKASTPLPENTPQHASPEDAAKSGWGKVAAFWAGKTIAGKPAETHFAAEKIVNWDSKSKTSWGKGLSNPATYGKYGLTDEERAAMQDHLTGKIYIGYKPSSAETPPTEKPPAASEPTHGDIINGILDKAGINPAVFNDPKVAASTANYLTSALASGNGSFGGVLNPDETSKLLSYVTGGRSEVPAAEPAGAGKVPAEQNMATLESAYAKLQGQSSLASVLDGSSSPHAAVLQSNAQAWMENPNYLTPSYGMGMEKLTPDELKAVQAEVARIAETGNPTLYGYGPPPSASTSPEATPPPEPSAPQSYSIGDAKQPIVDALGGPGKYQLVQGDDHIKVYPTKYGSPVSDKVAAATLVSALKQQGIYAKVSYGHAKVKVVAGSDYLYVGNKNLAASVTPSAGGKPVGVGKPVSAPKIPSGKLSADQEALVASAADKMSSYGKVGTNLKEMLAGKGTPGGTYTASQLQTHYANILSGAETPNANEAAALAALTSDEKTALGAKVAALENVLQAQQAAADAKTAAQLQVGSGGEKDFGTQASKGNAYSALVGKQWQSTWSADEKKAVSAYKGWSHSSENLRAAMQDGAALSPEQVKISQSLQGALDRYVQPEPVVLYRYVDTVSNPNSWLDSGKVAGYKPGARFTEPGFGSTSIRSDSYGSNRNTLLRIHVPKGFQGIAPIENSGESEWLHQRQMQFKITGVSKQGHRTVLDVAPVQSMATFHGAPPFTTHELDATNIPTEAEIASFNGTQVESGNASVIESGNATERTIGG